MRCRASCQGDLSAPARELLPLLRGLGDRAHEPWIDLGHPAERQQAVALLLDVRQLRVAEALDRATAHQAFDQPAVGPQQLAAPSHLSVTPAARPGQLETAEF